MEVGNFGWKLLLNTLAWTMNINSCILMVKIKRKQHIEKIVTEPVSHEAVAELSYELVVMSSSLEM